MKKCFLLFISIILLLAGCKVKSDHKDIKEYENKISIDISEKIDNISISSGEELLLDNEYCNIIYFDAKQLIFTKDGDINQELDTAEALFYYYDIKSGKTVYLTKIENVYSSTQDIAILENRIYYPLSINENDVLIEYILEISLDDFECRLVKSRETDSSVTRLEATDNEVFRYYQREISNDETDFYIDNIGSLDKIENVIYTKYRDKAGNILVSTCVYKDRIFTYSIIYNEKKEYVIGEYSLEGELLNQYNIDLTEFLKIKEVNDTDVVYRIFREGNYFILNTLNNRIKIYKIIEGQGQLIDVETPPEFEELLGARVIENYGNNSNYVYFMDSTGGNIIYIFDIKKGKINKFNISGNDIQSNNILRDTEGNIITITQTDDSYKYFFISLDDIVDNLN
jgi:hypothetical protein